MLFSSFSFNQDKVIWGLSLYACVFIKNGVMTEDEGKCKKKVSRFQHSGGWHFYNEGKWVSHPGRNSL